MNYKNKIIKFGSIVLLIIAIFITGIVFSQQSKDINKHLMKVKDPHNQESINTSAYTWLSSYLNSYQNKYNFKQPINSYNIKIFSLEESYDDIFVYRAQINIVADQNNLSLFKEKPECDEISCIYDLILYLSLDEDTLKYHDDKSYEKFDEMKTFWRYEGEIDENVDPLAGLYHLDQEYLVVRESTQEKWITTPVLSSSFDIKSQGWYQNDKRLYVSGNHIVIVHKDEGINLTQSFDKGETWSTLKIINELELSNMSRAYIGFDEDHGFVSVLSYVAINSHVMTIFETLDGGESWIKSFTPDRNMHIYDSSVLDDKLYFTFNKSTSLYRTDDLGATFTEIVLPEGSLEHQANWSEIFVQAEAPEKKGDRYIMLVNQGENGDYKGMVKARYISADKGETWKFDGLFEPEKQVELN